MHLLAAPMLAGLVLASVPILIHLWNKRRFQLVEWAPMKYLKLTIKTNRRRMRIEQLLLLAVRTLVIILLFVALARPSLSRGGLGGWLASRARTSRVIVIDDSLSMGYQADRRSAFETAKEAVTQTIRAIGAQDSVTILLTSRPGDPLVREVSLADSSKLLNQIGELKPADSACDYTTVFKRIEDYLNSAAHPQKELVIFTDLRRSGWGAGVSPVVQQWASRSLDVKIIDVGSRQTENVALTRLEQEDAVALPGTPLKLRAAIRNDTPVAIRQAQATLEIDGQSRPLVLPDLPAGQTIELPLTVALSKTGSHVLRLTLPTDALVADNTRWLAVNVRSEIKVAVIDGQISSRPFESSSDFLQAALTAGFDPWQIVRRSDSEWQRTLLDAQVTGADMIVLTNVASLAGQQASALEKLVAAGAGLMIFGGEQVDVTAYEQLLHRDGASVLPGRLARAVDAEGSGLVVEPFGDSPLGLLGKIAPEALSRIRPKRFLGITVDPNRDHDVRVLARWNDSQAHPAVIEKRFGRGRVMLWTISADRQWGDWPIDPTYVLAVRSAALAIARADGAVGNFTAGQEIAYPIDEGQVARNPTVMRPEQGAAQAMQVDGQRLRFGSTAQAGAYQLKWTDARNAEQSRSLCASFDVAESNLEPIGETELSELLSPLSPVYVHWGAAANDALAEKGREMWRNIVLAVLVLAGVETVLAMWVGRER